ncbi:MAG: hypothetical protein NWF05_00010 [Candidatus Bathyarchaeota archaeon]|nr:hypothetical protein [Candidatus Bathyarchaeota archaeon]
MTEKTNEPEKEHLKELKEMIQARKEQDSVEEVLAVFCQRHGLSLQKCERYYNQLVAEGEIQKNNLQK